MFAQVHDSRARAAVVEVVVEAEDGVPDDADQVVEVAKGLFDPAAHQRVYRDLCGALQMQPDREDRLDDLVVKLGGGVVRLPRDIRLAARALRPFRIVRERHPHSPATGLARARWPVPGPRPGPAGDA